MNKKFSTLVAGLLLATSVGTVTAQTYASPTAATLATKLVEGKCYQLGVTAGGTSTAAATNVLAMEETGLNSGKYKLVVKQLVGATAKLPNTLWKVSVKQNGEGALSYQFINVATNMPLSLNSAMAAKPISSTGTISAYPVPAGDALTVGGDVSTWKWQPAVTSVSGYQSLEMYSAFGAKLDSAVTMVATATIVSDVQVGAAKYALANKPTSDAKQVFLAPFEAGAVVLTPDDLNSMLWTQKYDASASKLQLTFDKDVEGTLKGNFFTSQSYKAVPAVGFPAETPTYLAPGTAVTNSDIAGLVTAEKAYKDALVNVALAAATEAVSAKNGLTDAKAAVTAIAVLATGGSSETSATSKDGLSTAVNAITLAESVAGFKSLPAVKAAVIAYIAGISTSVGNKVDALTVIDAAVLTSGNEGIAFKVANAADLTTAAGVVKTYTDAAATANTALATAYTTAKGTFTTNAKATDAQWVSLRANDETAADQMTYLAVDTSFVTNLAGEKHLAFALKKFKDVNSLPADDVTRMDLNGRFNFQFMYYPSSDSIVIRTAGFAKRSENLANWTDMTATTNPADLGIAKAASTGTPTASALPKEMNLIKIAVLADNHREVTVGSSEFKAGATPLSTINTRISIGRTLTDNRTTLASGLYFLNLKSNLAERRSENGGYKMIHLNGDAVYAAENQSQLLGSIQNFGYMPATQWVIEQSAFGEAGKQLVSIYNREYPATKMENVQLYTDGQGGLALPYGTGSFAALDTLSASSVSMVKPEVKEAYTNKYLGYVTIDSMTLNEKFINLDYLSGIDLGNYVNVMDTKSDSLIRVDMKGDKVNLVLETAPVYAEGFYGYNGVLSQGASKLFPEVRRTAYVIRVKDANKLVNNDKYIVEVGKSTIGEPVYAIASVGKSDAAKFFLKENNRIVAEEKEVPYYALVSASQPALLTAADTLWSEGTIRAGIKDGSLYMTQQPKNTKTVAAFALTEDNSPLYRRLGVTNKKDGFADNDTAWAKIYTINSTAKEYLYEDAHSKYSVDATGKSLGINFLGLEGKGDNALSSLYIDTAYVRNVTNMPQYMIAVGVTTVPDGLWCPDNAEHNSAEYIDKHGDCGHRVPTKGYKMGRYLINAEDSVQTAVNGKDYIWNREYTRLAFVQAKHIGDTLIICRNGVPSKAAVDSIFLGDNQHNQKTNKNGMHAAHKNGIKNPVFAFRLIDDEPQADFLIESEGDHKIPSEARCGWVKIQNGVPVIARYQKGYNEAVTDAEKFNIDVTKEIPTDNETINTTEVSVIAGNGQVVINNAAGKTVVLSNILGQTIANTVLTSDNATIAVPAGVAVVSVDGEAAVKVVVR